MVVVGRTWIDGIDEAGDLQRRDDDASGTAAVLRHGGRVYAGRGARLATRARGRLRAVERRGERIARRRVLRDIRFPRGGSSPT